VASVNTGKKLLFGGQKRSREEQSEAKPTKRT